MEWALGMEKKSVHYFQVGWAFKANSRVIRGWHITGW